MSQFRLSVIYEDDKVYVELKPEDFKRILIEQIYLLQNVEEAFDATCKILKNKMISM